MLLLLGCYNSFAFEYKGVYYGSLMVALLYQNRKLVERDFGEIVIPEEVVCKEYAYERSVTYHVVGIDEQCILK